MASISDLDSRLADLERRLEGIAEWMTQIDGGLAEAKQLAHAAVELAQTCQTRLAEGDGGRNGAGNGIEELTAAVARLNERVDKIASTIVAQASRWS